MTVTTTKIVAGTPTPSGTYYKAWLNGALNPNLSFFRGGYWAQCGTAWPNTEFMSSYCITQGTPSQYANQHFQLSFMHYGSSFTLYHKGNGTDYVIKVNDRLVSGMPYNPPSDGFRYYTLVDFAGVADVRRIDIQGRHWDLGGVYCAASDGVAPAPKRGPNGVIILGDSFLEGAGNELSPLLSYGWYFAEYMGWDDVVMSALGQTGLISAPSPKVNFPTRAARDVAGLNPEQLIVVQSINDHTQTPTDVVTAAALLVSNLAAAGWAKTGVSFVSPSISTGRPYLTPNVVAQSAAMAAWCASQSYNISIFSIRVGLLETGI